MSLSVPPQFPKRCGCGLVHSEAGWNALPLKGEQISDWDSLELRDCSCASTLAVVRAIFMFDEVAA